MWKTKFYKIINDIDTYVVEDENNFHKHIESIYQDILSLQLILVDIDKSNTKFNYSHLITFALTAYCDERLNILAVTSGYSHEMLQTRLFKTLEAGSLYYEYLEYILSRGTEPNVDVCWVYYYLLMHGYEGMYSSSKYFERSLYLRQLKILIKDQMGQGSLKVKSFNFRKLYKNFFYKVKRRLGLIPIMCLLSSFIIINYM
ncbi:hypothetical protein LA02_1241 [Francisella philomiragia]|uniref:DotU family type IV/VI secretion system protein n=1 Tax=Francisella philomiragia TaxID=28110 RepID=UPI0005A57DB4|nr:DotU family type IV/VI secretion system protein [Francisella philomiragia]AJI56567.1 hypothetical protein LA02_1241 [Francisella philomiragia]